ncbi:N2227-domain-containing protein [Auriculariales sp. MPI-PUGE-AT-0066]|nr:N2227-domain-containing protein [Auriculariales sp. MPI-PUGE-AT-0066]
MPSQIHEDEEAEELAAFGKVIAAFRNYERDAHSANNRRRKDAYRVPFPDRELLHQLGWHEKLVDVDEAIAVNAKFVKTLVAQTQIFGEQGEEVVNPNIDDDDGYEEDESRDNKMQDLSSERHDAHYPAHGSHSHSHGGQPHSHGSRGHSHGHPQTAVASVPRKTQDDRPSENEMEKVRSTIKQFVREWSAEGKAERDQCYAPMLEALLKSFEHIPEANRGSVRVLVPGCGLARLAYDVAALGFASQGNEFSQYMLLASHFILNRTSKINQHTIYPFIHSFSNVRRREDLLRQVRVPDVLPSAILGRDFSLVAGDFVEVYSKESTEDEPQHGLWDAILTCFFLDTAKNIMEYLRIIHSILKPDGVWINLGPLLWHFENNNTGDVSIELDLEELMQLIDMAGFRIETQRTIDTTYATSIGGMLTYLYSAQFWVARKKE